MREEEKGITSPMKLLWKNECLTKKTAHELVVSYAKQTIFITITKLHLGVYT